MRRLSIIESESGQIHEATILANPTSHRHLIRQTRQRLARLTISNLRHHSENPPASDGATDQELVRLTGPLGRLGAEDVRWDLIGSAHTGRRHRI